MEHRHIRVGSKVGEEEEVGNAKSVREHGHGKRVIEMRWLNDGRLMLISGGTGQHPMRVLLPLLSPPSEVIGRPAWDSFTCWSTLASAGLASHSASVLLSNINPWPGEQVEAGSGKMTGRVEVSSSEGMHRQDVKPIA